MKEVVTRTGEAYAVSSDTGCTVVTDTGKKLLSVPAGRQLVFWAESEITRVSDDGASLIPARDIPGSLTLVQGVNDAITATVRLTPAGTTEDNFDAYGFVCVATKSGTVTGLDIECRADGTATPANTPVYVKIWRGNTTVLARSTNACQHSVAATLRYEFEPFAVNAGDELRVTFHEEAGLATDAWQMGVNCCMRAVGLTEGESGGFLNSNGGYSSNAWTAKYAWQMLVEKYAPAEHVDDAGAHLTAQQHEVLTWLIENKTRLEAMMAAAEVENTSTEE